MSSSRQRVAHSLRVAVTAGEVFPIQSPLARTNPATIHTKMFPPKTCATPNVFFTNGNEIPKSVTNMFFLSLKAMAL